MTYYSHGLGNGTFPGKKYEFNIVDLSLFIPGDYVGKDGIGEPHHIEQENWLNSLAPGINIRAVWYGNWQFATIEDRNKFIKLLSSMA